MNYIENEALVYLLLWIFKFQVIKIFDTYFYILCVLFKLLFYYKNIDNYNNYYIF